MKITLNGPALVAMIKDGGEDFVFELRKGILKEAAKHSRLLAGELFDNAIARAQAQFEASLNTLAIKKLGKFTGHWNSRSFQFNAPVQKSIETSVKNAVLDAARARLGTAAVKKYIQERIELRYDGLDRQIDELITKYIDEQINARIVKGVQDRLDAAAKGKL